MTFRHEMTGDGADLPGSGPRDVDLHRVWLGVAAEVWRRRPGLVERLAGRALRSPGLARALVTTPSLLPGWVIASAVVLTAGMFATLGTGTPFVALFAPAVAALGRPGDPEREVWRLLYVEDRPVAEVAALLGVPAGTVKSRAHRVRQLMRGVLRQPVRDGGER